MSRLTQLLNILLLILFPLKTNAVATLFKANGDCTSGPEHRLANVDSIHECETKCLEYDSNCRWITMTKTAPYLCWFQSSCTSSNDIAIYQVFEITQEICTSTCRKRCDSNVALDIVFLMDESGSIDENEWNSVIDFITRVITWDINEFSYVSFVEFGSVQTEATSDDFTQFLDFTQATPANRVQMTNALKNNPWTAGGFTCTADAVERTLKLFGEWDSNNNINNERANLLFLITDGEPECFGGEVVCPGLTAMVSNSNVEIALIGVGDALDPLTWTDKLECLYNNKEKDTFYVSTFSSEDFAPIEGDLRAKTCVQQVVIESESIPVVSPVPYLSSLFMKSTESQLSSVQNEIYLLYIIVFCLLPLNLFVCFRMVYWCLSQKNGHVTFYDKARQNDPEQL